MSEPRDLAADDPRPEGNNSGAPENLRAEEGEAVPGVSQSAVAAELVEQFEKDWQHGDRRGGLEWLKEHVKEYSPSEVLDVAFEECALRLKSLEPFDPEQFAATYAPWQREVLELTRYLQASSAFPELAPVLTDDNWPIAGSLVEDVVIESELGRGAFARVYRGKDRSTGDRPVVLKVSAFDTGEAKIQGKFTHPHIVPIHWAGYSQRWGLYLVCMPFQGESTLADVIAATKDSTPTSASIINAVVSREPPSSASGGVAETLATRRTRHTSRLSYYDAVTEFGAQLADALATAHDAGFCHLDLKPSNVLVVDVDNVMLFDFNLASDTQAAERKLGGTLPYMAPEELYRLLTENVATPPDGAVPKVAQQRDAKTGADPRSDIFALGVLLYELLTGAVPFPAPDRTGRSQKLSERAEEMLARQQALPQTPAIRNRQVDPALSALVMRCISLEPDSRPQSAHAVAGELKHMLSIRGRSRRWMRMHPLQASLLAATMGLLLATAAVSWALQPSASVRALASGRAALIAGQGREALSDLTLAAEDPELTADALVLRARAHMAIDEFALAIRDLARANGLREDPLNDALRSYAYSKTKQAIIAIKYGEAARENGLAPDWLLNNLGWSYIAAGKPDEARKCFDEVIDKWPDVSSAYLGRIDTHLVRFNATDEDLRSVLSDVATLVKLRGEHQKFRLSALSAICRLKSPTDTDRAAGLDNLRRAIELGAPTKTLRNIFQIGDLPGAEELLQGRQDESGQAESFEVFMTPPLN